MKLNVLNLLFALYIVVLVLMGVKFYHAKRLTNLDIILHLLLVAVLGFLIMYTGRVVSKKEQFQASGIDTTVKGNNEPADNNNNNNTPTSAGSCPEVLTDVRYVETNYANGSPLEYKMGPYSNVRLDAQKHQNRRVLIPGFEEEMFLGEKESDCGNMHSPCANKYIRKPFHVTPTGEEKTEVSHELSAPSIDGNEGSPKKLFMFAHNRCHPGCCPSTYTCSRGCVCTTKDQRKFIGNRGMA